METVGYLILLCVLAFIVEAVYHAYSVARDAEDKSKY